MRKVFIYGFFFIGAIVGLVFWGLDWSSRRHEKPRILAMSKEIALGQGVPRYGGKPSLPVFVESDIQGEIEAGKWIPIQLSILVDMECSEFTVQLRGLEGVEVDSPSQRYSCNPGSSSTHRAQIRVEEGGSGVLAVDVGLVTEEGDRQVTRAVPFQATSRSRQSMSSD